MGVSPFFTNYGYNLRWTDDLQHDAADELERTADNSPESKAGQDHAGAMKEINKHLWSEMLQV